MNEFFVRVIPLPPRVEACVTPNDDGTFSIYVNAMLSEAARKRAVRHEIEHIMNDHLYSSEPVAKIEKRTPV